jgi:hypothetical protein
MDCPVCQAVNDAESVYCAHCGRPLAPGGAPVVAGDASCLNHSDREVSGLCSQCAEGFCSECLPEGSGTLCPACRKRVEGAPAGEPRPTAPLANEALFLSIGALVCCVLAFVFGPWALIKARAAEKQIRESGGELGGEGRVTAARVLAGIALTVWFLSMLGQLAKR